MVRKPLDYKATILEREDIAKDLAIFRIRPEFEGFPETFVPGQYTLLGLNHPEKGSVQRAYSIASPPDDLPDFMDFYVRRVAKPASDNPLTHLLFELGAGDRIYLGSKIRGNFTLEHELGRPDDPRLKICVAAGTGLAPFTSMVFHEHRNGRDVSEFLVLHGASYPNQLGYMREMESIMNGDPDRLRYFPTISREPDAPWAFDRGRVETFFEEDKLEDLERRAGLEPGFLTPDNAVVFICGLQGTIASTLTRLLHRGFVPAERKLRRALWIPEDVSGSLFFEQYDAEPILDLKDEELMVDCRDRLERAGVKLAPPEDEPVRVISGN
ncbi:MAG: FAD-binding oxidoreductase [Sumerlaeia bacterium]